MALAGRRGWRTGRGTASAVEGPWPYAPVLEALGDLCRRHPALLDGLDDAYRAEIERALSGRDVTWSGESGHQRLFVAAAELVRLAASGHGLLLVVDDLHEADEASLRLLHYLSRVAVTEPVLLALAHGQPAGEAVLAMGDSLVARGTGTRIELAPLDRAATRRLLADRYPDLAPDVVEQIWAASAGLPFTVLEMARSQAAGGADGVLPALPPAVLRTFQRVALLGSMFSTDELLAVSGVGEDEAYRHLEAGLAGLIVAAVRQRLLLPPRPGPRGAGRSRCRRTSRPRPVVRWPSGSPPWGSRRAGWRTTSWPRGCRRGRCPTCCGPSRPPVRSVPTGTRSPWSTGSASTPDPTTCRACCPGAATC